MPDPTCRRAPGHYQSNLGSHNTWGPFQKRMLSENSEYVNPEMRETLGFPFQKREGLPNTRKQGKSSPFLKER